MGSSFRRERTIFSWDNLFPYCFIFFILIIYLKIRLIHIIIINILITIFLTSKDIQSVIYCGTTLAISL